MELVNIHENLYWTKIKIKFLNNKQLNGDNELRNYYKNYIII